MKTSAPPDLLNQALEDLACNRYLLRRALLRRAPTFAGIEASLAALGAAATSVAVRTIHMENRLGPDDDLLVFATAPADHRAAMPADRAGLREINPSWECAVTLFEHPTQRWMLHLRWISAAAAAVEA